MVDDNNLQFSFSAPVRAYNAGLFLSKGKWIHSERVIDSYELIFVRQGTLSMHENGNKFLIKPGQTLLLWPGRTHGGTEFNPEDLQFYWIHFDVKAEKRKGTDTLIQIPQTVTLKRPDRFTELFRRFLDDQESKCLDQTSADLLVMLMLCQVAQAQRLSDPSGGTAVVLAQRAESYIRTNFDRPISTSTVARALDCNPDYLGRVFREIYGTSPTNFIHKVRLQHARALLMDTGMSVSQIARECGFDDSGYFRRVFRHNEGMSPLAYRKLYARVHVNIR
jgi:AraC-like DNA-binding protein/mannose-6-phosphate isomerase-like protein (cupin superfamily)